MASRSPLQEEGTAGFFKGLRAKILQTALNAALMLMLKEQCFNATKAALSGSPPGSKALSEAAGKMAAGLATAVK